METITSQPCISVNSSEEACTLLMNTQTDEIEKILYKVQNDSGILNGSDFSSMLSPDALQFSLVALPEIRVDLFTYFRQKLADLCVILCLLAYIVYLVFVVKYDTHRAAYVTIDIIVVVFLSLLWFDKLRQTKDYLIKKIWGQARDFKCCNVLPVRFTRFLAWTKRYTRRICTITVLVIVVIIIAVDSYNRPRALIPLSGIVAFLTLLWASSTHPCKVQWTPVIWGLMLQYIMGLLILRWHSGYVVCKAIGKAIAGFLQFANVGSEFVFGAKYTDHPVAFQILPTVVFFYAVVNILYYWGIMQRIIAAIARGLKFVMTTSPMESFATAAHIFIGTVETVSIIKPFLGEVTISELNAILTGGFATVAGTVLAAYVSFGVPPEHVISASFISAPAALAVAKISYPETKSKLSKKFNVKIKSGHGSNVMEAAFLGAVMSIKVISYVVVSLVAFPALLAFVDFCLSFMGARVGYPQFTFELICSYVFMPVAVLSGVPWEDCNLVGKLIGKKIFLNEFLAYGDLGLLIKAKKLQEDSIVIATYLLCGFGSIAAMGINLGALVAAEPSRREDYIKVMSRAMIGGNIACFITACVAGMLLTTPSPLATVMGFNDTQSPTNSSVLKSTEIPLFSNVSSVF